MRLILLSIILLLGFSSGCQDGSSKAGTLSDVLLHDSAPKLLEKYNKANPDNPPIESIQDLAKSDAVLNALASRLEKAFDESQVTEIVAKLQKECHVTNNKEEPRLYKFKVDTQPKGFAIAVLQAWIEEIEIKLLTAAVMDSTQIVEGDQTEAELLKTEKECESLIAILPEAFTAGLPAKGEGYWKKLTSKIDTELDQLRKNSAMVIGEQNQSVDEKALRNLFDLRKLIQHRQRLSDELTMIRQVSQAKITPGGTYNGKRVVTFLTVPHNDDITESDIEDYRQRKERCSELPKLEFERKKR